MTHDEILRKDLGSEEFLKLREATEKISNVLNKRLKSHLSILNSLFMPKRLFGTYIKSSTADEVSGSDKVFAELQEKYAVICKKPFDLPSKLQPPLTLQSHQVEASPFRYPLSLGGAENKTITVTSPGCWTLSYGGECALPRLKGMLSNAEPQQREVMKQAIIHHLLLMIFLNHFPALGRLLEDLRYQLEIREFPELGGLPVVMLKAPVATFLPPDEFLLQVTQFSGIPAFQEIFDPEALENLIDPLKASLTEVIGA